MEEETANSITHGLGLLASIVASAVLLVQAAHSTHPGVMLGCTIYALSMISVYAASTLSHAVHEPSWRHFFRMLDQACIYLMISGTYTPFGLTFLRGGWLWALLAAMWIVAIVGFMSKTWLKHRINAATSWSYVLLGWLPMTAIGPIRRYVPDDALWWMLLGGIWYTVGTVFLTFDYRTRFFHAVWHILVIAGSAAHFWAIFRYIATLSA